MVDKLLALARGEVTDGEVREAIAAVAQGTASFDEEIARCRSRAPDVVGLDCPQAEELIADWAAGMDGLVVAAVVSRQIPISLTAAGLQLLGQLMWGGIHEIDGGTQLSEAASCFLAIASGPSMSLSVFARGLAALAQLVGEPIETTNLELYVGLVALAVAHRLGVRLDLADPESLRAAVRSAQDGHGHAELETWLRAAIDTRTERETSR